MSESDIYEVVPHAKMVDYNHNSYLFLFYVLRTYMVFCFQCQTHVLHQGVPTRVHLYHRVIINVNVLMGLHWRITTSVLRSMSVTKMSTIVHLTKIIIDSF